MPIVNEPDITLASTTESQAELDHATSPNWREHFDPEKAKAAAESDKTKNQAGESSKEKDETKTAADSATAKTASKEKEAQKSEDDDLPPGVRKRIDRLTARLRETEEALDTVRRGQKPPEKEAAKPANADPEPQLKDFKTWEEFNQAHTRWAVRDENRKLQAKNADEEAKASAKEIYDAHLERLETARTAHDDFDKAIESMPVFEFSSEAANRAFQMAIVEADNGPELMYHLATHPEEMAKFADLSPVRVLLMVGRLSDKLTPTSANTNTATARTTAKSKAPAPTVPVRGTSPASSDLADPNLVKDTDAWIRQRNSQLSQRRRAN